MIVASTFSGKLASTSNDSGMLDTTAPLMFLLENPAPTARAVAVTHPE
jgi:hypothetical protein